MLRKPLATMPHTGGQRFRADSRESRILVKWIEEGARADFAAAPKLARLEVTPTAQVVRGTALRQQITARAHFADGTTRDVTREAVYEPSDPAIRDFRGLQENDWDFNAPDSIPGFGTFKSDVEIRELAARVFGTHNEASEPIPQVAPADRPTEPAGEEAAAALDKVQVAEAMPGAAMSDDASAAAAQQSDDSPEPVVTARKHGGALPH